MLYIQETYDGTVACNDDVDFDNGDIHPSLRSIWWLVKLAIVIDGYDEFAQGDYALDIFLSNEIDCTDGLDEDADGAVDCADAIVQLTQPAPLHLSKRCGADTGIGVLTGDLTQASRQASSIMFCRGRK